MLRELWVENYAVVENLAVEFAPGLNLLTGETGAGKSILVDALSLLLGEKASPDVIRHGAEKAVIGAVFEVRGRRATELLDANGVTADDPDLVIVRREISAAGKGRVFVNNQPATVALLRQLAPELAVIHAQNESLLGFDAATRLELLDQFAGLDISGVASAFDSWNRLRTRIADLQNDEKERLRMADLWSFQAKEIEAAGLQPGEDERLESEKRVLANAEKIHSAAMGAYDALYDGAAAAATSLRSAERQLEELVRYEPKLRDSQAALEAARIAVEDTSATLRDYAGGIYASPERLAEIEDRLALLDRLKRKYGATLEQVIAHGEDCRRKLAEIETRDDVLRELHSQLGTASSACLVEARRISRKRKQAATELEKRVEAEVNGLAMKARFRVEVVSSEDEQAWTAAGFDQVMYLIATNPGEPLAPVERIASGGELSRVMLALKVSIESRASKPEADGRGPTTLIFDEIDTGIGGRAAEAVGRKLKSLAQRHQVLCVTHLPQIASCADHHYVVEKRESSGRTRATIRRLDADERKREIARMLSGARLTETSLEHAAQLLKANA